jgi:hypothetical protein
MNIDGQGRGVTQWGHVTQWGQVLRCDIAMQDLTPTPGVAMQDLTPPLLCDPTPAVTPPLLLVLQCKT